MSKRIQGITIEIDGSTSKLNDALKDTNSVIAKTNSELKNLNSALKLDPKNTELLAQKQELLKKNISETTNKLNTLKEAQRQMGDYNKLTEEQKESYRALSVEITKAESSLKGMKNELKETNSVKLDGLKNGLQQAGEVAKKVGEIVATAVAAIATAAAAALKKILDLAKATAEYGDTVDKESQKLGISSDNYQKLDYAMRMSGSTIDDVSKGVKNITKDLAAFANGSSSAAEKYEAIGVSLTNVDGSLKSEEELLLSTIQALADMTDETQRDAAAQEIFGKSAAELKPLLNEGADGIKALMEEAEQYGMVMSKEGVKASAVFDDSLTRLTGTLTGFRNNIMTGLLPSLTKITDGLSLLVIGADNADEKIEEGINETIENITEILPKVLDKLESVINAILPKLIGFILELAPKLLDTISSVIDTLSKALINNQDKFQKAITTILTSIITFIGTNVPKIVEMALTLVKTLANSLIDTIPLLCDTAVEMLFDVIDLVLDNLDEIIELALTLITTLATGLIQALPKLLDKVPEIIVKLVSELTKPEFLLMIVKAAFTLVLELAKGLIQCLPELMLYTPKLIIGIVQSLKETIFNTDWGKLGREIIEGVLNGMLDVGSLIVNTVKKTCTRITSAIKNFFGIHSPSTLMEDEIGTNLTAGIVEGMENSIPNAIKDVNAAMTDLNNGIQSSVNPVINPTANTNPLYLTIENFYNNRDTDIQTLAQELEFYRKNAALAKGGM
ncbi:MAG: hypothetical protein IKR57_01600 [Bacilli bacterium]|nr:hypothetical protein [Bacilli bacterium]MBR6690761.1 hypothetical protein [Bacilli bacterium]